MAGRRRWVPLVAALIAVVLIAVTTPWWLGNWPVILAAIWLVAIGAVAYVAVRLAMR